MFLLLCRCVPGVLVNPAVVVVSKSTAAGSAVGGDSDGVLFVSKYTPPKYPLDYYIYIYISMKSRRPPSMA